MLSTTSTELNVLQHLSGIASETRRYVDAIAGLSCRILDTRKTLPGWRVLDKYAVRAGGGHNHRMGLFDGVLVKDNHLAALAEQKIALREWLSSARQSGEPLACASGSEGGGEEAPFVEIEVDRLEQLDDVFAV